VIWIVVVLLFVLGLIELIGRPPPAPANSPSAPREHERTHLISAGAHVLALATVLGSEQQLRQGMPGKLVRVTAPVAPGNAVLRPPVSIADRKYASRCQFGKRFV
jgi:hypothetical protein